MLLQSLLAEEREGGGGRDLYSFVRCHWLDRSSWLDWSFFKQEIRAKRHTTQYITMFKYMAVSWTLLDLGKQCHQWPPPNALTSLKIHWYTNMPLIHFIDFYLTFKFCPLTKTVGFLHVCWECVGWSFTYKASTKASQGRWMIAIIKVCSCNIHNNKKQQLSFCNVSV